MTTKDEALKLAQDLRTLADRFSEDWHDGIKIDASDIMLLTDAAATLAEPAQPQEPLFKPLIDLHPGLAEELKAMDAPAQQEHVERGGLRFYTNGAERQHWKADGSIDFKDEQGNVTMTIAAGSITSSQPSKPLTDEQMFEMVKIAWRHGWASCRDAEYVGEEAEDERWGMVGAEVVQDIAAYCIKENT